MRAAPRGRAGQLQRTTLPQSSHSSGLAGPSAAPSPIAAIAQGAAQSTGSPAPRPARAEERRAPAADVAAMSPSTVRSSAIAAVAALLPQLLALPMPAAAATMAQQRRCSAATASDVAHICGSSPIDVSLLESIWLEPSAALTVAPEAKALLSRLLRAVLLKCAGVAEAQRFALQAQHQLAMLGFRKALDLQLLAGPESAELMDELKSNGVAISDRAKIRLLLGDAPPILRGTPLHITNNSQLRSGRPHSELSDSHQPTAGATESPLRRAVQEAEARGLSMDTMAIAFSVLVGAVGYVVQAYTARRAENSERARAAELHQFETARQRDHEMMLAQIGRTNRMLDDCCRPLGHTLSCILCSRYAFVAKATMELETSAPEVVRTMLDQVSSHYVVDSYGTRASKVSDGRLFWDPDQLREWTASFLRHHGSIFDTLSTAASSVVGIMDLTYYASQPWCSELPSVMLATLAADPTTNFARRFRSYVKHDLLRDMQRVTELLEQHGCVVDLPPFEFLRAKFPQDAWDIQPASQYQMYFVARTRQWEALGR